MNINILDKSPGPNTAKLYTKCISVLGLAVPSKPVVSGIGLLTHDDIYGDSNLKSGIHAVKPGPNVQVHLFDNPTGSGTPFRIFYPGDPVICLSPIDSSKIESIRIVKLELFASFQNMKLFGLNSAEIFILIILLLILLIFLFYLYEGSANKDMLFIIDA